MNKKQKISCLLFLLFSITVHAQLRYATENDGRDERQFFIQSLTRIADPVLNALSKNELHKLMPVEAVNVKERSITTHLEAFGRLLSGMSYWLELGAANTPEGMLRKKYIDLSLRCIRNAFDSSSADFMYFNKDRQHVVDAAFFAEALLRAPTQLWEPLDAGTKHRILAAFKSSRVITPSYTNWLLFSATIEAALMKFGNEGDELRMDYAIKQFMLWYKGDGAYGDGPDFHWDYYNSFVIHPMLLETLDVIRTDPKNPNTKYYADELKRAQRYAAVQERLISPEGTYPVIGRSLAYRFGAFHLLSKVAYMHALPAEVQPQQVRAALYTMIKKQIEAPGTFDQNGWLQIGMYGHQPKIGEGYISTGSLYLCSEAFLVLGLPETDIFWQGKDVPWTSLKVWSGENISTDHAITN
ncbi:MAG: hypothetical protein JWN76_2775 [Chitinophagaceae bacterium]|nr:hypothetical protein [Chitinophagaceae bacterium]